MESGFYKLEGDQLLHGPNFVTNRHYRLLRGEQEQHEYPVDGWYWFESCESACEFFDLDPTVWCGTTEEEEEQDKEEA